MLQYLFFPLFTLQRSLQVSYTCVHTIGCMLLRSTVTDRQHSTPGEDLRVGDCSSAFYSLQQILGEYVLLTQFTSRICTLRSFAIVGISLLHCVQKDEYLLIIGRFSLEACGLQWQLQQQPSNITAENVDDWRMKTTLELHGCILHVAMCSVIYSHDRKFVPS